MSNSSALSNVASNEPIVKREITLLQTVKEFFSNRDYKFYLALSTAFVFAGAGIYWYRSSKPSRPRSRKSKKGKTSRTNTAKGNRSLSTEDSTEYENYSPIEIDTLPLEKRVEASEMLRARGNNAYNQQDFEKAVELYTQAIAFHANPVFYSNRAACYFNTNQFLKVIEDCNDALRMDPCYVKALNRRGAAYEKTMQYQESLNDYTASCIIDSFGNATSVTSMDRLLKTIAESKAQDIMKDRIKRSPTTRFITAYLDSFRPDHPEVNDEFAVQLNGETKIESKIELKSDANFEENNSDQSRDDASEQNGDLWLKKARSYMKEQKYGEAVTSLNKAIDFGCFNMAEAFEMRGTFSYLDGESETAFQDFTKAIELKPDFIKPYIKRASTYLERGNIQEALHEFEEAIRRNPNDPDIYYHRGQVNFITEKFENATKDYEQSIKLDGDFIFSYVQLAIAKYKMGSIESAIETFQQGLEKFDQSAEMHNYYGELLLDLQRFDEATTQFDKAIQLQKDNPLPYVNKALLIYQRQEPAQAEELCRQALEIEPESEVANAAMSHILLQQGKVESALKYIEKCVETARTTPELVGHLQFAEAAKSQLTFARNYPEFSERLSISR